MSDVLNRLRQQARSRRRRIIFPEAEDPRVRAAAAEFNKDLGHAVLLLHPSSPAPPGGVEAHVMDSASDTFQAAAGKYRELRAKKGITPAEARTQLTDPLLYAALLVRLGHVDGCVAGSVATTAEVLRAAIRGVGTMPGQRLVSSFFLMERNDRVFTYADCGVVPNPGASDLAEIAITSAASHKKLTGEEPKVALLSFSTLGSAEHESLDKIRTALAAVKRAEPALAIDGELQFDAAFVPDVAHRKAPGSPVAGAANVFIFPDLNAGNIAYKITERLGGVTALGPLLQGLAKPCMDLSRGCTVSDIVDVAVVAANLVA